MVTFSATEMSQAPSARKIDFVCLRELQQPARRVFMHRDFHSGERFRILYQTSSG
jgi:hypothetical protein